MRTALTSAALLAGVVLLSGTFADPAPAGQPAVQVAHAPTPAQVERAIGLFGEYRRAIQTGLGLLGFDPGPADGVFGRRTRAAVAKWQASAGKPATGYLGAEAAWALAREGGAGSDPTRLRPGSPAVHAAVWEVYNSTGTGSAFAIEAPKRNRFVTNAHVIGVGLLKAKSGPITLLQEGNKDSPRFHRLVAISTTYDLAVFETDKPVRHHLRISGSFDKDKAEDLYVVGYPHGSFTVLR